MREPGLPPDIGDQDVMIWRYLDPTKFFAMLVDPFAYSTHSARQVRRHPDIMST
jgi:hypothetical protein